jgi:predicted PurR-regulated permease PerM
MLSPRAALRSRPRLGRGTGPGFHSDAPTSGGKDRKAKPGRGAFTDHHWIVGCGPTAWFAQKFAEQATSVPESIQKQIAVGKWRVSADKHPQVARFLAFVEQQVTSTENGATAHSLAQNSRFQTHQRIGSCRSSGFLDVLFFVLFPSRSERVLRNIRSFLPLSDDETDMVFARVNETIQASLYGMLALSALQGVLGGLLYWCSVFLHHTSGPW